MSSRPETGGFFCYSIFAHIFIMARFSPLIVVLFLWGGSNGKPENKLILPDTDNAVEGKKENKRVLVNTKALYFYNANER